jgi:DNA-binding beta-propeller fold protein YncE/predicted Ser/Thr protein kinase
MMADLSPGSRLAGYRIEERVGRGGMGVVYRATQLGLNRPVALKLIAAELADDERFRQRFKRESELAASIDHPNVIPIYEAGEGEGRLFIAMRYVEGTDLRTALAYHSHLAPKRATVIVAQLAAALDAAHRRGLVHRDIKPANALVDRDEHVYLTDFGLTKRTGSESALTETGQFVGTIDYVAPEQIEGKGADARADIYALGCVFFHLITGQVPFPRDDDVARLYAHLQEPPPRPSQFREGIPPSLDGVTARAMTKDPAERYPSAGDFARAAQAALTGEPTLHPERSVATGMAAPTVVVDRGDRAPTAPLPRTAAAPPPPLESTRKQGLGARIPSATGRSRTRRRNQLLLGGALATAVVAGALVAALGYDGDSGGEPRVKTATIRNVGDGPDGITVNGDNVWVALANQDAIRRIDANTRRPVGEATPVGANPDSVVSDGAKVWVTNKNGNSLQRLSIAGEQLVPDGSIQVGRSPEGLALGRNVVWVASSGDNEVRAVSRDENVLVGEGVEAGEEPRVLAVGSRYVWVASSGGTGTVTRVDPAGPSRHDSLNLRGEPRGLAIGEGRVWVSDTDHGEVLSLDPSTGEVRKRISAGSDPRELAYGHGSVWAVNSEANSVTRIDARTGRVLDRAIPVGPHPIGVAVGQRSVWIANFEGHSVTELRP